MRRDSPLSRYSINWLPLLGLLFLLSALAHAQARDDAAPPAGGAGDEALLKACEQDLACSSHVRLANQFYEQNNFSAALDEYRAAYILQPYPLILYNIARIHHRQTNLSEAQVYYRRYLDTGHAQRAERARQLIAEIDAQLRNEQLAQESLPEPEPAPLLVQAPPPLQPALPKVERQSRPIYKRWWFWTLLGGVAAAGITTAVVLSVYSREPDVEGLPAKTFTFGN